MTQSHRSLIAAVLVCLSSASCLGHAQSLPDVLNCTISNKYDQNSAGLFVPWQKENLESLLPSHDGHNTFTVDRRTGMVLGKYVNNNTNEWNTRLIDDGGQKGQYFKLISQNKTGFIHVKYLQINLWSEDPKKPFVLVDGGTNTGTCQ